MLYTFCEKIADCICQTKNKFQNLYLSSKSSNKNPTFCFWSSISLGLEKEAKQYISVATITRNLHYKQEQRKEIRRGPFQDIPIWAQRRNYYKFWSFIWNVRNNVNVAVEKWEEIIFFCFCFLLILFSSIFLGQSFSSLKQSDTI